MRAFIHAFRGRPWNKECCDAKDGFHKLGIETVMFTTNEEFDLRKPEDVVVGGTVIVLHALHQRGIVTGRCCRGRNSHSAACATPEGDCS